MHTLHHAPSNVIGSHREMCHTSFDIWGVPGPELDNFQVNESGSHMWYPWTLPITRH